MGIMNDVWTLFYVGSTRNIQLGERHGADASYREAWYLTKKYGVVSTMNTRTGELRQVLQDGTEKKIVF